jgi:hypothetical protein
MLIFSDGFEKTIQSKSVLVFSAMLLFFLSNAQEKPEASAQEVADKLSNPVSNLISVPFQALTLAFPK